MTKKLVNINELLTHCLNHKEFLLSKKESIPNWLPIFMSDLEFRIKIGKTKEYVSQLTLDELKIKGIVNHEPIVEENDDEPTEIEKPVKIKKEKVKSVTRKETALSLMRELIVEGTLDDESVAQKILDTYPGSTYNKHMVKFQRKKMENS